MNHIAILLLILLANFSIGQVSTSQKKKIQKVVGEDFIQHPARSNYPFALHPETCIVDTSTTFVGDTTGLIFNNEYVLFRDFIHFKKEKELFSLINPNVVTVGEYQEFKDYVRDSIARYTIIQNVLDNFEAIKFLQLHPRERKKTAVAAIVNSKGYRRFEPCEYPLNWKRSVSSSDTDHAHSFFYLYLFENERFRKVREFDERTFWYRYQCFLPTTKKRNEFATECDFLREASWENAEVNFQLPVANDIAIWAKNAIHNDDELGILSQLYGKMDTDNPVVGVLGAQANAFCHWKQRQLQRGVNEKKLPYTIVVTLPTPDQLSDLPMTTTLSIPACDYTDQWKITKSEYAQFMDYVRDSVTRKIIYNSLDRDEDANKFLSSIQRYYLNSSNEYDEFNPCDRDLNEYRFPLNFKAKIKPEHLLNEKVTKIMNDQTLYDRYFKYSYSSRRTIAKATLPKYDVDASGRYVEIDQVEVDYFGNGSRMSRKTFASPYQRNELCFDSGVRLIKNLQDYIAHFSVRVLIDTLLIEGDPTSLIPSLSYEQALAFYNWKFPIDKFNPEKDSWQGFVYPSEEQFSAIQRGEMIVIPEHDVKYPTPLFRYVVHVFPKD